MAQQLMQGAEAAKALGVASDLALSLTISISASWTRKCELWSSTRAAEKLMGAAHQTSPPWNPESDVREDDTFAGPA